MMQTRLFPGLVLFALLLASCAPAAVTEAPAEPAAPAVAVEPSATTAPQVDAPPAEPTLEAAVPTPLPVATSRGPELHATDPSTVNLAAGQLQFVEFFRFT
jgi:PBP1b-binding outer membrane lipoprotein LpoB